ncbi:MAG TPA: hypothetical protein VM840_05755 [Actinomycetota bacterium]|nr:hypothetical protein [Actinomycetota bacterium]
MERRTSLTAVFDVVENGWIQAQIREIPGVITAAPTQEEAEEMLLDALHEYLLSFGPTKAEARPRAGDSRKIVVTTST